ncbi:MAG: LPO_1073/Vpar_1526 family protein [Pseudomonadota bacterium]
MLNKEQNQTTGDNSTNIQVGGNATIVQGISYQDAKTIAHDVVREDFQRLSGEVKLLVQEMFSDIQSSFFSKMEAQNISTEAFATPSFQWSFRNAQIGYAKNGNEELKENLVELLLERAKEVKKSRKQILLDEAIEVLPKLSQEHIDYLSFFIALTYTTMSSLITLDKFRNYIQRNVLSFYHDSFLDDTFPSYIRHFKLVTVLEEGSHFKPLEERFRLNLQGLFSKGFPISEIEMILNRIHCKEPICMPCLHDKSKIQFNVLTVSCLKSKIKALNLDNQEKAILDLFEKSTMSPPEIKKFILDDIPGIENIFLVWRKSSFSLKALKPTPLGVLIGEINYNKKLNESLSLHDLLY